MRRVLDELGNDAIFIPVDKYHFKTTVMKRPDERFCKWLYSYGANAKILSPPDVISKFMTMLHSKLHTFETLYSSEELLLDPYSGIRLYEEWVAVDDSKYWFHYW